MAYAVAFDSLEERYQADAPVQVTSRLAKSLSIIERTPEVEFLSTLKFISARTSAEKHLAIEVARELEASYKRQEVISAPLLHFFPPHREFVILL